MTKTLYGLLSVLIILPIILWASSAYDNTDSKIYYTKSFAHITSFGPTPTPTATPTPTPEPPMQIADIELWLSADTNSSFNGGSITDGTAVASWDDISGNAKHTTQSNNDYKPTYNTNIVNGKPAVRFTQGANNDCMEMHADPLLATDQAFSIVFVAKQETAPEFASLGQWEYQSNDSLIFGASTNATYLRFFWGGLTWASFKETATDLGTAAWHWILLTYNGSGASTDTNYAYYVDNSAKTVSTNGGSIAGVGSTGCIGAQNHSGTPSSGWDGYIAEVLHYSRALDAGERTIIDTWVNDEYGF